MTSNHDSGKQEFLYITKWSEYQHPQTHKWVKLYREILRDKDYVLATPNQRHSMLAALILADHEGRLVNNLNWLTVNSGCESFELNYLLSIKYLTTDEQSLNKSGTEDSIYSTSISTKGVPKETEEFLQFWSAYGRKQSKQDAIKAFHQVDGTNHLTHILSALKKLSADWAEMKSKGEERFIPMAGTWLRGRRWEDDLSSSHKTDLQKFDELNRGAL